MLGRIDYSRGGRDWGQMKTGLVYTNGKMPPPPGLGPACTNGGWDGAELASEDVSGDESFRFAEPSFLLGLRAQMQNFPNNQQDLLQDMSQRYILCAFGSWLFVRNLNHENGMTAMGRIVSSVIWFQIFVLYCLLQSINARAQAPPTKPVNSNEPCSGYASEDLRVPQFTETPTEQQLKAVDSLFSKSIVLTAHDHCYSVHDFADMKAGGITARTIKLTTDNVYWAGGTRSSFLPPLLTVPIQPMRLISPRPLEMLSTWSRPCRMSRS